MSSFLSASLLCFGTSLSVSSSNHVSTLPNSCIGQEDGDHWLLLSSESSDSSSYPAVELRCSNEYAVLDVSKSPDLSSYFSSFEKWHFHIAGPANHDPVTWSDWFLPQASAPEDSTGSFVLSPDCNTCDAGDERQVHETQTTYWMTGNLAKLHWGVIGFNECDMDTDTYQCYDCTVCLDIGALCDPTPYATNTTDWDMAGICGVTVQSADRDINRQRNVAQRAKAINYKPSIGTDGEYCVCYKPDQAETLELTQEQQDAMETQIISGDKNKNVFGEGNVLDYFNVFAGDKLDAEPQDKEAKKVKKEEKKAQKAQTAQKEKVFYLSQADFSEGTLRIHESGRYVITEDIVFDFNKDDDWWPTASQADEYPGAAGYRDAYHLGFFAGIAIETDYVTIDLNGKELKMSVDFYFQQRWFTLIELGNQQFLPGQGPAFFGSNPVAVSHVSIINGVLGRSSHMAIHGNYPKNLQIENVHIKDFATHGLQLNGWHKLVIQNVEIGPASKIEYLKGDYAHGRILQQRLRGIEREGLDRSEMEFADRGVMSIGDIADELDLQMMLAFDYASNRVAGKYEENDYISPKYLEDDDIYTEERWEATKKTFVHESGFPSSSSITGLFLNFEGASVFSYTMYTQHQSGEGVLRNIYIHDITHDMVESTRLTIQGSPTQMYPTPWNSDIPAEAMVGSKARQLELHELLLQDAPDANELAKFRYVGSVMSDAYYAMGYLSDNWDFLGFLQVFGMYGDLDVLDWVQGKGDFNSLWAFGCNQDIMGHSGKGLLGLRVDGVDSLRLENVIVENLHERSPLGSKACGDYKQLDKESGGGHFKQSPPMQLGFSGNDLQAVSIIASTNVELGNFFVSGLKNEFSQAFGVSFWTANDVRLLPDTMIVVKDVRAGTTLEKGALSYSSLPNRSPEACGVRLEDETGFDESYYESFVDVGEQNGLRSVFSCDIDGHEVCLGGQDEDQVYDWTMFGTYREDGRLCENLRWSNEAESLEWMLHVKKYGAKMNIMASANDWNDWNPMGMEAKAETEEVEFDKEVDQVVKKVSEGVKQAEQERDDMMYQLGSFLMACVVIALVVTGVCFVRAWECFTKNGNKHADIEWERPRREENSTYGQYWGEDNESEQYKSMNTDYGSI